MRFSPFLLAAVPLFAQFPPGYVDPKPVLDAASRAIGGDKLRCVTVAGEAYAGVVGQQRESAWNVDWPRIEPLKNFARTMDWDNGAMVERFERTPGRNPASWKYGQGWRGGTPWQRERQQAFFVNGKFGWHRDGPAGPPVAAPPEDAERWQLDLWLNQHGFLKAAKLPGANPKAVWRWELGEHGRDGHTTSPEKVTVVSITMFGKYRVDATINQRNLLQRIHTWVPDPVLGDMNYEHEFSDADYVDVGDGIRFPTVWHHHDGWDDNFGALNVSAGHNGFGGKLDKITANSCPAPPPVPDAVRRADHSPRVTAEKLADGVWLLGGGSHNSVAVEFEKFIAVVEAPLDETRSLGVIEEIVKRIPNKPIRYVVNTHQHFDHAGGLRTYMHIGTTIITYWRNFDFYNRDFLNYVPRTLVPDMISLWPPTELSEGYQYELVRENYTLADDTRRLHVSYVQPLQHVEGMLAVYLAKEKMLIEADLSGRPAGGGPTAENRALYDHVRRLGVPVETIVPIHGRPMAWRDFAAAFPR
jgi:glyoxylase-like metal-dependent hydrolase (beta-lactamase superfamily II)